MNTLKVKDGDQRMPEEWKKILNEFQHKCPENISSLVRIVSVTFPDSGGTSWLFEITKATDLKIVIRQEIFYCPFCGKKLYGGL